MSETAVPIEPDPGHASDHAYRLIRAQILSGARAGGDWLREGDLADSIGVSRTPVREALLRLGETGLVRAAPGRSTVVAEIDLAEVREAHAVVVSMHRLAVAEAVARLTPADLDTMRRANERFAAALEERDTDAALAADDEFHAVAVDASGNRALATVLEQFSPVVRRLERLRFASLAGEESVVLHDRLVLACAAGDADAAAEVAFRTWQNLADLIPDSQPDTRPDPQETP